MYKSGEGIVRDIDQAMYWYKKIVKHKNREDIQDKLEELFRY